MWWERQRGAGADRGVRRASPGDLDRALPGHERQVDDGRRPRELHRRDARAVRRRPRRHDRQPRPQSRSTPRASRRGCPGSMPSGSSRTSTRSATGRSASRSTPSRRRARRTARPTRVPTSPTSRSSTRTTSAGSASSTSSPTPSRYWACHEGQMDNLTIPFLGDRWRWQYPFRSLRAAGAVLAMGSDWSVSTPEPAARDGARGRARRRREPRRPRAVPAGRAARPHRRARRVHGRVGVREPPRRRDRHARGRQGGRLASSTATCSIGGRAPSARPASSARSSRASPSTRTPPSTELPRAPHGRCAGVRARPWTDDDVRFRHRTSVVRQGVEAMLLLRTGWTGTQKGAIKQ